MTTTLQFSNRRIDPHTRQILASAQIHGTHVRLAEQLTPAEYTPVKKILEALGGVWTRSAGALVFPAHRDPASLIADTLNAGRIPLAPRASDGYVRTPDDTAEQICGYPYTNLRFLPAGARVLEPSAGDGALSAAILDENPQVHVTAVEPDAGRASVLAADARLTVVHGRFEDYAAHAIEAGQRFDAVVMNPPFALPGAPTVWAGHLRLAWHLLAPGARLVAIVPNSLVYRHDTTHRVIRDLIAAHGGHHALPAGAFTDAGTGIATRVVWMAKPLTIPGRPYVFRQYSGDETPVRVECPRLSGEAVTAAPVQIWYDAWRCQDRLLRFRATCVRCGWLLWGFDDGENDPRGVLGDCTSGFSLDAWEHGHDGPSIGLCHRCANTGEQYRAACADAITLWQTTAVAQPA